MHFGTCFTRSLQQCLLTIVPTFLCVPGSTSEGLVIKANALEGNKAYLARISINCATCAASYVQFRIETNSPPITGMCYGDPYSGKVFFTLSSCNKNTFSRNKTVLFPVVENGCITIVQNTFYLSYYLIRSGLENKVLRQM